MEQQILTVEQCAALLHISTHSCYRAIKRGEIPALRFGKLYRVPKVALEKLLQKCQVGSGVNG